LVPNAASGGRGAGHQEQAPHRLWLHGQDVQGAPRRLQPVAIANRAAGEAARKEFFYINDDAQLVAMRYDNWKMVFCEQRAQGTLRIWAEPFTCLRLPKLFNLRLDPYERSDITSNSYYDWAIQRAFMIVPSQALVQQFVATFKDFPPRQKPSSFSVDEVLAQMERSHGQ
jgi:arylsulfatase